MDIRTKLALALVLVSLLSMALLGTFAYQISAGLLQEISLRQLDALAESKKRDLVKVQEGWRDQLRLIRSGSDLRHNLREYLTNEDRQALARVTDIIESAVTASDNIDRITVLDSQGNEVTGFGRAAILHQPIVPETPDDIAYGGSYLTGPERLRVLFSSQLTLNGEMIGAIEVVFDGLDVFSVTDNRTGLGETGESIVIMREGDDYVVLNAVRHDSQDELLRIPVASAAEPMQRALAQQDHVFSKPVRDYRDASVWAATRYLDDLEWGLIVKMDAAEEAKRANGLREVMIDVALALSAFAIIGGTLLGIYLARPIHELALLVERVRQGETDLRADDSGDDEIAYLAESLNELLEHLESGDGLGKPQPGEPGQNPPGTGNG